MEIAVMPEGGKTLLKVVGRIDENGAEELKRRVLELDTVNMKELVLDFQGVSFIGSAGIGKLLLFYKRMAPHGGRIRIINMPREIYPMFTVTKLDQIFSITRA